VTAADPSLLDPAGLQVISPELVLVDPELAALARRVLQDVPAAAAPQEGVSTLSAEVGSPRTAPRRTWTGAVGFMLCASIALNVLVLRYAWDDGIRPGSFGAIASPPVLRSQPPTPGPRFGIAGAHADGVSRGAQPNRSWQASVAAEPRVAPPLKPPNVEPARAGSTGPTPTTVQLRLLAALASEPALRGRFLNSAGLPLSGVSARCSRAPRASPVAAPFRCVVWRQPESMQNGMSVNVHVLSDSRLSVVVVR